MKLEKSTKVGIIIIDAGKAKVHKARWQQTARWAASLIFVIFSLVLLSILTLYAQYYIVRQGRDSSESVFNARFLTHSHREVVLNFQNDLVQGDFSLEGKLEPVSPDVTVFSTTNRISLTNAFAILSWLRTGASILMFVDHPEKVPEDIDRLPLWMRVALDEAGFNEESRFKAIKIPRIGGWGLPLMNDTFLMADELVTTKWLCFVNGDIMLPGRDRFSNLTRYANQILASMQQQNLSSNPMTPKKKKHDEVDVQNSLLVGEDLVFTAGRFSCLFKKNDSRSLDILDFYDASGRRNESRTCFYYGNGGKDLFMYRKGFFQRRNITLLPFLLGGPIWDHWMVDRFWSWTIDITSFAPVLHIDPDVRKMFNYRMATVNAGLAACMDSQRKLVEAGGLFNKSWGLYRCFHHMNIRQLLWHLCPSVVHEGKVVLDFLEKRDYLLPGGLNRHFQDLAPQLPSSKEFHMKWSEHMCRTTIQHELAGEPTILLS